METGGATGQSAKEEDQDFTGDSGFGTASRYYDDHDAYCVVDLWKRPPGNPKPGIITIIIVQPSSHMQVLYSQYNNII